MKKSTLKNLLFCTIVFSLPVSLTPAQAQTLEEAVMQALQTHPALLVTQKERLAIRQNLRQAQAGYLPSVDLSAGYGEEHAENLSVPTPDHTNTLSRQEGHVAINQMLFDGFSTAHNIERSRARLTSADYKSWGTAQDTAFNATQAYLTVIEEESLVKAAQNNLKTHQKIYNLIHTRASGGLDQTANLAQAAGRLDLAKANLLAEESNLADAQSNYLLTVGTAPQDLISPAPPSLLFLPHSRQEAVTLALYRHPLLKSAKADVDAAAAQHAGAKAPYFPRFDLQLSAQRNNNLDGIEARNNSEQAMVRMSYNLYHGGADKARQEETAYLYQASVETLHKTYRQVVNNVELAWNNWIAAKNRIPLLKQHRDNASESFESYQQQFQLQKRTLLDVLDAQNEYYEASRAYIQGDYLEKIGQYRVLNGTGSLIQAERIRFANVS